MKNIQTNQISTGIFILVLFIFSRVNEPTEDGEESQNDLLSGDEYDVGQRRFRNYRPGPA